MKLSLKNFILNSLFLSLLIGISLGKSEPSFIEVPGDITINHKLKGKSLYIAETQESIKCD